MSRSESLKKAYAEGRMTGSKGKTWTNSAETREKRSKIMKERAAKGQAGFQQSHVMQAALDARKESDRKRQEETPTCKFHDCVTKATRGRGGRGPVESGYCAFHQRHDKKLRTYGIDLEHLAKYFDERGGECEGCDLKLAWIGKKAGEATLNVDHCHDTNVFRGILCRSCNIAVGWSKNKPKTLRRLADYLEKK